MEHIDLIVLRTLTKWRAESKRCMLATVARTWGSSPRPVGSIMALCDDGAVVGSVSGGCIEDDLVHRFSRVDAPSAPAEGGFAGCIPDGPPQLVRYGVSADEAHRFGLPCGGTVELLLEFNPEPSGLEQLLRWLDEGRLVERTVQLTDGGASLRSCERPGEPRLDADAIVNVFGPGYRLLIIGAGQLGEYLATMALFNGFAVTVCDPRDEVRGSWAVAGVDIAAGMPDDVVLQYNPDRRCAIVALTHDPKLDDLALLEALQTDAFYVGALGSRRNNLARRQRLIEHFGASEADLLRLHGPIGIHIGSRTPSEIAVSVMAEILAVKNGVVPPESTKVGPAKDSREPQARASGCPVCSAVSGATTAIRTA